MGKIIAVANQKGGVGKTTTAVNVAACMAEAGCLTLVVDLDPQCNATAAFGLERDPGTSIAAVWRGNVSIRDAIRDAYIDQLKVVTATPDFAAAQHEGEREGEQLVLPPILAEVRDDFEYIYLDCPPALGEITINALAAADQVLLPIQAEYFALEGLAAMLETVSLVQSNLNPRLTVAGLVLTMYDGRTKLARDVQQEVQDHFPQLALKTVIPRNVRLSEAPSFGKPVIRHDPHSTGARSYFALARELADKS